MSTRTPLLSLTILLLCCDICHAIQCVICSHDGLSMVPPSALNTRLVFNSEEDNCFEDPITCPSHEPYCLASMAIVQSQYWIRKGCISANEFGNRNLLNRSSCVEEFFDAGKISDFPVGVPVIPHRLRVINCACNNNNSCNAGSVTDMRRRSAASPRTLSQIPDYHRVIIIAIAIIVARSRLVML